MDCTDVIATCQFYLILQDDGNMCIYRGTGPNDNKGLIWQSQTNGQQFTRGNPKSLATLGKYGRNYMRVGEYLNPNEWIGSTNGSLKLVMQSDGNLILYTSELSPGCNNKAGKMYGVQWVNAVYKLNEMGNAGVLGKVGYIDDDSKLREYPVSMLTYSNDYIVYQGADTGGNDIKSLQIADQKGCETECNKNNECAAYVYQPTTKTCWLKNMSVYPRGDKQPNDNVVLGVRKSESITRATRIEKYKEEQEELNRLNIEKEMERQKRLENMAKLKGQFKS